METTTHGGTDFIVSELLSELKAENQRKDRQLHNWQKAFFSVVIAMTVAMLLIVGGFLWYLNQYDFSGTTTNEYTTMQTAEGVYAVVDSDGNIVGHDLSVEQLNKLMEELTNGESNCPEE